MKTIHTLTFVFLSFVIVASCTLKRNSKIKNQKSQFNLSNYVNPFIGTGGHGHTYPGATMPFGMVQLSPDTRLDGWDGCSGYHYDDNHIYGFSHTHLQGTGVSDYGDILFMPTNHKIKIADTWNDAYKSSFSHSEEIAKPGYYKVNLKDYNIEAELTVTERIGIHRYTFATGDSCRLFIDMMHRDELYYYDIETIGDTAIRGYRVSKGWAAEQHCYFYAVFNKPFKNFIQLDVNYTEVDSIKKTTRKILEQVQVFSLTFDPTDQIMIKVGISGTDMDGAKNNCLSEAPHWDFDRYVKSASDKWEQQLNKIELKSEDKTELTNFYTSLYHCSTTPNLWSDVDGRYRGMDNKIHEAVGYNHYTVFSLWDTFRALHPLFTKIEKERTRDFIHTFLNMYNESGHLPIWELAGNETNCMIGYHAVSVIADAYAKGIRDFDHNLALKAMVATATIYGDDKKRLEEFGYLPSDEFAESVSKTLEYAYNDWCIAQFAKSIGNEEVYRRFIKRSQNWKNLFDPKTGFMRARANGGFVEPFDPYEVNFNYTEANAWQYFLFVPHDMGTLIDYLGGPDSLEKKLDMLFSASSNTTGREQADITGLIGQYAHGNEPSHHLAYLYNYTNAPEKCGQMVERILNTQYQNAPDGLCGNEDCGQMSAWYVMSKMGEYSVCPGGNLPNEKNYLTRSTADQSNSNFIIEEKRTSSIKSNSEKITENIVLPSPIIQSINSTFTDSSFVQIYCADTSAFIEISEHRPCINPLTGKKEMANSGSYEPFKGEKRIDFWNNRIFEATSYNEKDGVSKTSVCIISQRSNNLIILDKSPADKPYNQNDSEGLTDGLNGSTDFRTGRWQGFQGKNFSATLDLKTEKAISEIDLSCLQDIKSWIWFPSSIEIEISDDGVNFSLAGSLLNKESISDYLPQTKLMPVAINKSCRYIRITTKPAFDIIPTWHLGAGGKPWIFVDEIIVR